MPVSGNVSVDSDLRHASPGLEHLGAYPPRGSSLGSGAHILLLPNCGTRTALEKAISQGILSLPQEDEIVGMYRAAERVLSVHGYRRYEISNWAKPGSNPDTIWPTGVTALPGHRRWRSGFWNSRR